ncbi:hypothetical protein HanXRQr2_Chr09g0367421 [Helianthus annuus]|uniref:Uncharacterized protein n=1 Tax=Helianthus annuus TaxID=4232 RepID=A0A251TSN1_HELAN|nr:hypothetical protein HanXRQr2_Chr09g0367421 [Helianthus annuus]
MNDQNHHTSQKDLEISSPNSQHRSSSSSSSSSSKQRYWKPINPTIKRFLHLLLELMAADVKIRKTPTTKARTLDNLLEDGAVHIRK